MNDPPANDHDKIEIDPDPTDKNPALPEYDRCKRPNADGAYERWPNEKNSCRDEFVDDDR